LTINVKRPNVKTIAGKLSNIINGLTREFTRPNIRLAIISTVILLPYPTPENSNEATNSPTPFISQDNRNLFNTALF